MKKISLPKIGIRPVIDGRRMGVRESLEAQTMNMAKATAALISEKLRHACGARVECVIADTCIAGMAESAACEEKFSSQNVGVTITVTPDAGYEVDQVNVTDKNGKEIPVKDLGSGRYSFTMPGSKVTVAASFKAAGHAFTDVPSGSYYADAVAWAVENGITGGISADTFAPNAACTRAQAVTFLWRAAGSPEPQSAETAFTDVKPGSYYEKAVAWAVENGITKGTSDTTFSPNMTCSRAQIVAFLWRSEKSPAAGTANPFADVKSTAYYADAVLWAVKENITKGTTSTTFSPNADCTRAQIVTFLWRCKK
mgnify:CR=1 FL=1